MDALSARHHLDAFPQHRERTALRAVEGGAASSRLCEQEDDVLLLAQVFVERYAARAGKPVRGFCPAVTEVLARYPWPGQVRELADCIEHAVAATSHEAITVEDLPAWILSGETSCRFEAMAAVEKRHIQRVLNAVQGNKALAARMLGFDRSTLYRKMDAYGLR